MATTIKTLTIRCKAFSGESIKTNKVRVETDGNVQVWDSVAGHYTNVHSLSESTIRRIRKLAK
jgi:hypothetical protein